MEVERPAVEVEARLDPLGILSSVDVRYRKTFRREPCSRILVIFAGNRACVSDIHTLSILNIVCDTFRQGMSVLKGVHDTTELGRYK